MRLVAVSVVKNEADVIEAFVRHTARWVDHHLIFDHQSTDGTRDILFALQREGLPLSLFTDDALGNLQQHRSNHLARLAATAHAADFILPLDADEFLSGPDRRTLEGALAGHTTSPVSIPLLDYCLSEADDPAELNPALRLRHASRSLSTTRKLMLPRTIVQDPLLTISKGSHEVSRGSEAIPAQPLPPDFFLAHLSQRSPAQQAIRLITAELQKLSRGQRHAGIDVHYRLGFQLLAENPALFAQISLRPASALQLRPVAYLGEALRYTPADDGSRVARALLPFLESLASSHGRLVDRLCPPDDSSAEAPSLRELEPAERFLSRAGRDDAFAGFAPLSGWAPREGPIAAAFLPVFHWGLAPATQLSLAPGLPSRLCGEAEVLTYSEGQSIEILAGESVVHRHVFARISQKEPLRFTFTRPPDNRLTIRYSTHLPANPRDPRLLAVIFLSLHISAAP